MTVVAGGAALGSGAFSQVEADRTVSVNTAGDGSALLQFVVDDSYNGISDSADDTVALNFEDINQDAVTTFEGALTVTNNGSDEVQLSASNVPNAITFDGLPATLSADGGSISIDVEIDLQNEQAPSGDETITFTAESTE